MYDKENNIELRKSTVNLDGRRLRETIWNNSSGNMHDVARRLYFSRSMLDEYSDNLDVTIHSYSELTDKRKIRTMHVVKDGSDVKVFNTVNKVEKVDK